MIALLDNGQDLDQCAEETCAALTLDRGMMYMYCTLTGVDMPDNNVDLTFIAHQLRQLMTQVGTLTDDMRVLTAMVLRLDHGQANLLDEVRAMHGQIARLADRVGKLETAPD